MKIEVVECCESKILRSVKNDLYSRDFREACSLTTMEAITMANKTSLKEIRRNMP